ncbi:hypothetical protein WQ57_22650 [Mesobacillus campisalis]|uniref:Uncharacterized protein n=1 Tax=Mesobacillus campisalis TaxID=1408103 RepID=A0A0M2SJC5_9BACI|nr:hypothetical protein WQ57_22650 [Mesobacillus campisalis]
MQEPHLPQLKLLPAGTAYNNKKDEQHDDEGKASAKTADVSWIAASITISVSKHKGKPPLLFFALSMAITIKYESTVKVYGRMPIINVFPESIWVGGTDWHSQGCQNTLKSI